MTLEPRWVDDRPRGGHMAVPTPNDLTEALPHFDEFLAALPRQNDIDRAVLAAKTALC